MNPRNRVLLLLAIATLLGSAPPAAEAGDGAAYHVDAVAGSDTTGDGSLAAPFQSLARLQSLTLVPGDCVRLKRGSVFRERLTLDTSGTAAAPLVVEAYGLGEDPMVSAGSLIPAGTA